MCGNPSNILKYSVVFAARGKQTKNRPEFVQYVNVFDRRVLFQNEVFVLATIASIASRLDLWIHLSEVPSSKPVGRVFVSKPFVISS